MISSLTIADRLGNARTLTGPELREAGLPEFEVFHGPDTEGPKLTGFSLSPARIDISGAPGAVTLSVAAADPLSGIGSVIVGVEPPGREPSVIRLTSECGGELPPSVGTRHAGTWNEPYPLVQHAIPGPYKVTGIYLCDLAGNTSTYYPEELEDLGFPTEFVETGPGDTTAPEVLGFSMEPTTLRASAGAASIAFYVHVRDADTGLGGPQLTGSAGLDVSFDTPYPVGEFGYTGRAAELVSGTSQDGIWKLSSTLGPDAPVGTYHVDQIFAEDRAGNIRYVKDAEMTAAGWPLDFQNLP